MTKTSIQEEKEMVLNLNLEEYPNRDTAIFQNQWGDTFICVMMPSDFKKAKTAIIYYEKEN